MKLFTSHYIHIPVHGNVIEYPESFFFSQLTYVAQCHLDLLSPAAVIQNPECGKYFDGFDGAQYLPNSYLAHRFPQDIII